MKHLTALLFSLALVCGLSAMAVAHVGVTTYMPNVPDPAAMVIDGNDDDWGWYDPAFAVTKAEMWDEVSGAEIPAGDFDVAYELAWSAPPDNMLYFFARVIDNQLRVAEATTGSWWKDDMLCLSFDADHSGGTFLGSELDHILNGQRMYMRVLPLPEDANPFNSMLEYGDFPQVTWSSHEPWFYTAWALLPATATSGSTDVTYTYEFKAALWDRHDYNAPEASIRHIFTPDRGLHIGIQFWDSDGEVTPSHHQKLKGIGTDINQNGDVMPDVVPLMTGPTVVEQSSWGRIKHHLDQLR